MRVPDDEWIPARDKAAEEGETMTDVIRRALRKYAAAAVLGALVLVSVGGTSEASAPSVAPVAVVASSDAAFVAVVRQIGAGTTIADQTDAYLIRGGKSICADIDAGATRASMWASVSKYYTPQMFQGVLQASVLAFCPGHLTVL